MAYVLTPLSETCVTHNTKTKKYPCGYISTTYCSKAVFKERNAEKAERAPKNDILAEIHIKPEGKKEQVTERDRTEEIMRRSIDKVRDIVLMNDFSYFLTITINPEEIDSFDVEAVRKKLRNWLSHMQQRKGLKYVLIPEYHKSGRIHAHALVNDVFKLVDSGRRCPNKDQTEWKIVYNVPEWKYGFTTAIRLDDDKFRLANYITKYITKGSDKIFGKYFWSSKNIRREPDILLTDTDYTAVEASEYKPLQRDETLGFKYETNMIYSKSKPQPTEFDYDIAIAYMEDLLNRSKQS